MNVGRLFLSAIALSVLGAGSVLGLDQGEIKLASSGPLAFGPDGLLLIADPMEATIYAVQTGDSSGSTDSVKIDVPDVRGKIASMLGADVQDVRINDLAINPASGNAYLAVARGSGDDAAALIMKIDGKSGSIDELPLNDVQYSKTTLPNPADSSASARENPRMQSITDMAFVDDNVYVAGLSNEEFASNLRSIPYPFAGPGSATNIEIYHGAHGQFETRSPVRTFAAYQVGDETNLLCAYTCTPLVRIPISSLKPESKVLGTTIAELGNRNRPLDMVVYQRDGKDYILMANSSRGVMKVDLATIQSQEGIQTRISGGGVAGIPYETISELEGVMQLDGLNHTHAVILVRDDDGAEHLRTIALP